MSVYPFIEAEKAQQQNVKRACELLKVSRAAYYAARAGRPSDRDREDAELTMRISAEHKRSRSRYGAPGIHAELRRQGRHSRKRIARLMRQAGLRGRAARRWKKTTIADPAAAARADAVRRDFTADAALVLSMDLGRLPQLPGLCHPRGDTLDRCQAVMNPSQAG